MARNYTPEFRGDAVRYALKHPELNNHQKAKYLGVPYHTLYGWIKLHRRKLMTCPSYKIPRKTFYNSSRYSSFRTCLC